MTFRPLLRPGAHLVRLDAQRLRVGSHPGVVVDDDPVTRTLLATVDGALAADQIVAGAAAATGADPGDVATRLDDLHRRGAVVDAASWPGGLPRDELAHAVVVGTDPTALRGRRHFTVAIGCDASTAGLRALLVTALDLGGIRVGDDPEPDLLVLTGRGEPARDTLLAAARAGLTTLPVALTDGLGLVGPWHRPGRTPCLLCADRARATWDPGHAASVVAPLATASRGHAVGVLLQQAVAAVVTADVLAAADGGRPRTVGRRVRLGPAPTALRSDRVPFVAGCPCHLLAHVS